MTPQLPSGTVTFLFTDIEGSTQLHQRLPEQMKVKMARHDSILRQALESNGGYIFKTVGDAFCSAFPTAEAALAAARQAQLELHAEDWGETPFKVRMGIHTGRADVQPDGDYSGYATLSRVQRLMSAGHGGQTLLSQVTEGLVRDELPSGLRLQDLGEHRLKDLVYPEHIYQVDIADLPDVFPALRTADVQLNNLPAQATPFVGRAPQIAAITGLLLNADVRLVTLLGPGGTGKTRLSLQVAQQVLDLFPNGVCFVPLAEDTAVERFVSRLALQLGVREGGRPLLESVRDYLRDKNMLLVLDNFEQLISAAPVAADLLASAPALKLLVSSRIALHVRANTNTPCRRWTYRAAEPRQKTWLPTSWCICSSSGHDPRSPVSH